MMLDFTHLAARRQQHVEMSAPAGRVFSLPKTTDLRPVQDSLYSAAYSGGRLGLSRPNRLKRFHDQFDVNTLDRHQSEHRADVGRERIGPLRSVLCIAPSTFVSLDECIPALIESHRSCCCQLRLEP